MIILAAGLSERMGVFKPLLPVGRRPAVLRCIDTALEAGIRVGDITVVTGFNAGALEPIVGGAHPEVRLAENATYREGMFSSVQTGLAALPAGTDAFFLLPADCCGVTSDALKMLIGRLCDVGENAVIRPSYQGRRGHPPLIPAKYARPLRAYAGDDGLKGFLRTLPAVEVEMDGPGALLDMDTPEDYAQLLVHLNLPVSPDRAQCAELFAKYKAPGDVVSHGEHVAAVALDLARSMASRGASLNTDLLESACLLHDIARTEANHARAGMNLLLKEGYPAAAKLVGMHMDLPDGVPDDIAEGELLFLADKLCRRGRIVSIDDRVNELSSAYPPDSEAFINALSRMASARAILVALTAKFGISAPGEDC